MANYHTANSIDQLMAVISQTDTPPAVIFMVDNSITQTGTGNVIGSKNVRSTITSNQDETQLRVLLELQETVTRLKIRNEQLEQENRKLRAGYTQETKPVYN